ncbi:ribonuclease G [Clostridium acetobutylicum]|uniref:Ribonucleases G/E family protein n=1 Tax=Clostridium acetobutylicum (strain ATCC 824 / DSM 792 / JCM 1419 / IAM 19013 / LMG 5710 / NBRC 13948 / NRRL B-527 / VKM B-1787 / 2291 / W) TaxID=272562 RepID=Q97JL8_CLOAB|nr:MULTISPECIES: ribonuclease E/G [Clostridium]AAK79227.1 Ribonucleases G/E family protein [Clostridium acetobutylicum ATCC 824]ADZ20307.1 Ribonuclease G/E family protein [Clostridium acetobutylicum EA 2018]AEI31739.1 ribonuclease G/E family protein [Clostridium acetobutylicum DSM 1731]AWV81523.1 ribonuclease E/G [Clostridium acetobutylicum]MBC2393162.1 ribonuclease E/G [Clostridium acetobutylicum]
MKKIFIERCTDFLKVAVLDNGEFKECFIEDEKEEIYSGAIYKGVVKNIVPAIKCAFVDIGNGKNGYLYMDSKFNNVNIKKGDEMLVEIVKESIGSKGPKVSNAITIPGRYSVIITLNTDINISKKISDSKYIKMLKENVKKPEDVGVMIRTNAQNVSLEDINNEIENLYETYVGIRKKAKYSNKVGIVYNAGGTIERIMRDNEDVADLTVVVNDKKDFDNIQNYILTKKDMKCNLKLHDSNISLMEYYGFEREIVKLIDRKVMLKCGGYLIIDNTEAMHVIDVNSGKNIKNSNLARTAFLTNMEAAKEAARQIILRNLSGIIVIDFIDITDEEAKSKIVNVLKQGFLKDKNKTIVYPFTELNIVQIARRRRGKSIYDYLEEKCDSCIGSGRKLNFEYMKNLMRNKVIRFLEEHEKAKSIYIEMDKRYENKISLDVEGFIKDIGADNLSVYIEYKSKPDVFKINFRELSSDMEKMQQYKIYG